MRPTSSTSTSAAPESMNLLKPRVSALTNESDCNFSAIFPQESREYTKRQLSSPLVTTTFLPSAPRKLFGSEMRFLSSSVCSYSPINRLVIFTTLSHWNRVYTTIHDRNPVIHTKNSCQLSGFSFQENTKDVL